VWHKRKPTSPAGSPPQSASPWTRAAPTSPKNPSPWTSSASKPTARAWSSSRANRDSTRRWTLQRRMSRRHRRSMARSSSILERCCRLRMWVGRRPWARLRGVRWVRGRRTRIIRWDWRGAMRDWWAWGRRGRRPRRTRRLRRRSRGWLMLKDLLARVLKCWSGDTSMQQQVIQALTTTNTTYCSHVSALELWRFASLSTDLFLPYQIFPTIIPLTKSSSNTTHLYVSPTHATARNPSASSPQTTSFHNEHPKPSGTSQQSWDFKAPKPHKGDPNINSSLERKNAPSTLPTPSPHPPPHTQPPKRPSSVLFPPSQACPIPAMSSHALTAYFPRPLTLASHFTPQNWLSCPYSSSGDSITPISWRCSTKPLNGTTRLVCVL